MLKIKNVYLPLGFDFSGLIPEASKALGCAPADILSCSLWRKSIDARHGIRYVCSLLAQLRIPEDAFVGGDIEAFRESAYKAPARVERRARVIVTGFGPAGIFCALTLARAGFAPVVLERGGDVDKRLEAVNSFWRGGELDEDCNVQFGEGGAGTFSDGKLTTGIKDPRCRHVLETLVSFGAPGDILTDAHPHIGTDRLRPIIASVREEIIRLGGAVLFNTRLERVIGHSDNTISIIASTAQGNRELTCDHLVLALGHSARDTTRQLYADGFTFIPKPFSLGVRIEHLQEDIDLALYREARRGLLPPAEYRLSAHLPDGRSVYTFCMCPGGVVVSSSSQRGGVVTNGMSLHARDGANANSALLVGVAPKDFPSGLPLAGLELQESIERSAFIAGGGDYRAPVQLVGDFLQNLPTRVFGRVKPSCLPGTAPGDIRSCLPAFVTDALALALPALGRRLRGFDSPEAVLTAPETRSSSPVRMLRGEDLRAEAHPNVYPCGEGAGYAGGIVSAAVDGIRAAEEICRASRL